MGNCGNCSGGCSITKEEALALNDRWIKENLKEPITDHSYHSPRISSEYCDCGTPLSLDIYNLCVFENEKVLVRGNNRVEDSEIKNIKVGDKVLSYSHNNNKFEFKEVEKIFNREVEELYEIETESGKKMLVTKEHPIFINNNSYIDAENVEVGDEVLVFDNGDWKRPTPWMEGDKNHKYKEEVEWECEICGKKKKSKPFKVKRVCSKKCQNILLSQIRKDVPLSEEHKNNISKGLQNSDKFKKMIKGRDVEGKKNPNWRKKVIYTCPECNSKKKVTERELEVLIEKGRVCSKKCMGAGVSRRLKDVPQPWTSERMKKYNPMFKQEVRDKMSKSLKERYTSGDLDWLKEKAVINLKKARVRVIEWHKVKENKDKIINRMKKNNPMFNKETRESVSKTLKEKYSRGELEGYWKGKNRTELFKELNSRLGMKGFISKGQQATYDLLDYNNIEFIGEYELDNPEIKAGKGFFIDAFLPDFNLGLEYDGYYTHFTKEGIVKQNKRDMIINKYYGIDIIRFSSIKDLPEIINTLKSIIGEVS